MKTSKFMLKHEKNAFKVKEVKVCSNSIFQQIDNFHNDKGNEGILTWKMEGHEMSMSI